MTCVLDTVHGGSATSDRARNAGGNCAGEVIAEEYS